MKAATWKERYESLRKRHNVHIGEARSHRSVFYAMVGMDGQGWRDEKHGFGSREDALVWAENYFKKIKETT